MIGKNVKMTTESNKINQYGIVAIATRPRLTSLLVIADRTERLSPTGGVTCPISIMIVIMTPIQIGSNPYPVSSGNTKGKVMIINDSPSKMHPNTTYSIMIIAKTAYLPISPDVVASRMSRGTPSTLIDCERMVAPRTINPIDPKTSTDRYTARPSSFIVRLPQKKEIKIATTTPTPAASVGVAMPATMLPSIARIKMITGQICFIPAKISANP